MTALRALLRQDKAQREGNGHRPCREPQRGIYATGAQPINIDLSMFWPGRIGREIIDQRFPK